jgi:hypothetical protein
MARNVNRQARARQAGIGQVVPFPSATSGLNLRDDIAAIQPDEARLLKNWLPNGSVLEPRKGYALQSTSVGSGDVTTVMVHEGVSANTPVAASNGGLFKVDAASPTTIAAASTYTDDAWVWANFGGKLLAVNGTDAPFDYDGTTLASTSWTGSGLTITNLRTVEIVRNRAWFTENNSADVWYGSIGGITGALTKFQLSQIANGGYCEAICSWTRDGGSGADDFAVFIMSTGEVIVYQGDPASTFSLVGKYRTSRPIGRKCYVKVGGDVVIITSSGFAPLSIVAGGQPTALVDIPIWGKVAPGIVQDFINYGTNQGWSGIYWKGLVIFNVPLGGGVARQYVLNSRAKPAWTTFDYPAKSFADYGGTLIFGGIDDATVWAVGGADDNGSVIELIARSGYLQSPNGLNWKVSKLKPFIRGAGPVSGFIDLSFDFNDGDLVGFEREFITSESDGMDWGDDWDGDWSGGLQTYSEWFDVGGRGYAVSLKSIIETKADDVAWTQTTLMVKQGGPRN